MNKEFICIVCPRGCILKVASEKDAAVSVDNISGYKCKRGLKYALDEIENPVRTLTTTINVGVSLRRMAPVKSSKPVPKELLFKCMDTVNSTSAATPLKPGDIIIKNILNTGADIISTSYVK